MDKKPLKTDHLRLRLTPDEKTKIEKRASKEGLPVSQYLRRVLKLAGVLVVLVFVGGCGGTYDTQCAGSAPIDCSLLGLSVCTSSYGNAAPHAFCTQECTTDDDCPDGVCANWWFPKGTHRVCVAPYWVSR